MSGIDTISTTPDPEHLIGKWQKNMKTSQTVLSALRSAQAQGRHCVFQSGPTEETIECRRHERAEREHEWVIIPPYR